MDSMISVIVPVYKVEKYLNKCVNSILGQTYQNLEIILIDDGSPDNCGAICDAYAKKDSRIEVIHKKNGGLSDARNSGLDIAKGDYIAFVDSDDYIHCEMIEKLLCSSKENDADISICSAQMVDEQNRALGVLPVTPGVYTGIQVIEEYDYFHGAYVVAWNKLYKRHIFDNLRYDVGKIHEDEFSFHRVFSKCKIVSCVDDALYYYLQRSGSIMSKRTALDVRNQIEALLLRIEWMQNNSISHDCIYRAINSTSKAVNEYSKIETDTCANVRRLIKQYIGILKKQVLRDGNIKHKIACLAEIISPGCLYSVRHYERE